MRQGAGVSDTSEAETQLGAVVVGTGFGVLTHVRALQAAGIAVVALVGRDATKAANRATQFAIPHALTDLRDALALPGVSVVAVATPPHTHHSIVLAAAAAGKHVLCEKPFAANAHEADEMLDAVQRAGVVHRLGTEWRYATGQAQLTRLVRGGAVGTPRFGLFALQIPTLADPTAELPGWWEDAAQGGGWLGAYGSHVIDQVRTTMGEIRSVTASLQTLAPRPRMTADDTFTVELRLDGDAVALLHSSCAIGGQFVATTKVTGTSGSAWLQGEEVWIDDGTGPRALAAPDDLPLIAPEPPPAALLHTTYDYWHSMGIDLVPYTRVYTEMAARILTGRDEVAPDPQPATFVDGAANQRVLDAIRASSTSGQRVAISGA
jgi:predicted dehydrogenase